MDFLADLKKKRFHNFRPRKRKQEDKLAEAIRTTLLRVISHNLIVLKVAVCQVVIDIIIITITATMDMDITTRVIPALLVHPL